MIGVLGASGKIGKLVIANLQKLYKDEVIKIGARDSSKFEGIQGLLIHKLDLKIRENVKGFFQGCDLVINCIGPSYLISPGLMEVARGEKVDFVDLGLVDRVNVPETKDTRIIYGAGTVPGLSGLVQNALLEEVKNPEEIRLKFFYEISDSFSKNAAYDYLRGVINASNDFVKEIGIVYKDPNSFLNVLKAYKPVEVATFPYPARIFPFYDEETDFVNGKMKSLASNVASEFYSLISGENFLDFLNKNIPKIKRGDLTLEEAGEILARVSEMDAKAHGRYVNITGAINYKDISGENHYKTIHIKTKGQAETSSSMASLIGMALREGEVSFGARPAFEAGLSNLIFRLKDLDIVEEFNVTEENIFFSN